MARKKTTKKQLPRDMYDYRVKLYEDGKYHWLYDLNLLKNPSLFLDVLWLWGVTFVIFAIIIFTIMILAGETDIKGLTTALGIIGLMSGIFLVLFTLSFFIYGCFLGGVYSAHFIMDENSIEHVQAPATEKIAKRLSVLTALAGLASNQPTVMGAGTLAYRTSMKMNYSDVKKVKAKRWINTIKVNERLYRNRVYVNKDDFDFVYGYISSHCENAKNSCD